MFFNEKILSQRLVKKNQTEGIYKIFQNFSEVCVHIFDFVKKTQSVQKLGLDLKGEPKDFLLCVLPGF